MIPEAAVEAALSALGEAYGEDAYCKNREYVRTALESAAPHMLAEVWHLAYWQGIVDERRGLDALECGPSRANPYRSEQ